MITTELQTVWIASDGKKFFTKKEALKYENKNKENRTWLERIRQPRK